jgi:hypothetical protein
MLALARVVALSVALAPLLAAGAEPTEAVYVLDLSSGSWTRIGPGLAALWSPDGGRLSFSDPRPGPDGFGYALWDGRGVRRLGSTEGVPVYMAWGRAALLVEEWAGGMAGSFQPPRVVVHDLAAGTVRVLGERARSRRGERWALYGGPLAMAPAGDWLAFSMAAGRDSPYHGVVTRRLVVVARADFGGLRVLGPGVPVRFLGERELAVETEVPSGVRLSGIEPATAHRRVLFDVPARRYDLSADGRRLTFECAVGARLGVCTQDSGGPRRWLAEGEEPDLSEDGAFVGFGRRGAATVRGARVWQPAIFVARVADGEVRRYDIPAGTPSPMGLAGGRRWWSLSPDGSKLALTLEEPP